MPLMLLMFCLPFFVSAQDTIPQKEKIYYWLDNQLYDKAAQHLEVLLKDSSNIEVVNDLARSYYFMQDYNRAIKLLNKALQFNPYDVTANRFMANIYELQNDYESAVPYLLRLSDTLKNNSLLFRELGNIYFSQEKHDSAKIFLEKAYAFGKEIPSVVASYSAFLMKQKNYDEAEKVLYDYYQHDSLNINIIDKMINSADARSRYDTIVKLSGNYFAKTGSAVNTNALVLKAHIYSYKADTAIALGNLLLDKKVLNEKVFYFLGIAYGEKNKFDSSRYFIERAIEFGLSPNVESYWLQIAKYAERADSTALAEAYRDTAYYVFHNPVSIFWNGMMYASAKALDKEKAKKFFTEFLQKSSADKEIPLHLKNRAVMWLKERP